jgi:hypothetical protein
MVESLSAGLLLTFARTWDCASKNRATVSYFWPLLACYGSGLVLTYLVIILSGAGQPALLYLVPCTLLPFLILAWQRGKLRRLWIGLAPDPSHANGTAARSQAGSDGSVGVDQQGDELEQLV